MTSFFVVIMQLRKICKSVSFSWLRLQLKQLIEKVSIRRFLQKFIFASTVLAVVGGCRGCRGH
jgi:uncharacterized membrane protein